MVVKGARGAEEKLLLIMGVGDSMYGFLPSSVRNSWKSRRRSEASPT